MKLERALEDDFLEYYHPVPRTFDEQQFNFFFSLSISLSRSLTAEIFLYMRARCLKCIETIKQQERFFLLLYVRRKNHRLTLGHFEKFSTNQYKIKNIYFFFYQSNAMSRCDYGIVKKVTKNFLSSHFPVSSRCFFVFSARDVNVLLDTQFYSRVVPCDTVRNRENVQKQQIHNSTLIYVHYQRPTLRRLLRFDYAEHKI